MEAGMQTSNGAGGGLAGRIALVGALDARNAADVREALTRLLDTTPGDVLVELNGVDIVDGVGLGVLAAAHRRAEREGRRLMLHGCQGPLRRVLMRTRLAYAIATQPDQVTT
jgi:anti-anti-sigma factor